MLFPVIDAQCMHQWVLLWAGLAVWGSFGGCCLEVSDTRLPCFLWFQLYLTPNKYFPVQRRVKSCGCSLGGGWLGLKLEHSLGVSVIPNSDCWWIHPDFGHIPPVNTNGNVTHECWRILPIIFGLRALSWEIPREKWPFAVRCRLQFIIYSAWWLLFTLQNCNAIRSLCKPLNGLSTLKKMCTWSASDLRHFHPSATLLAPLVLSLIYASLSWTSWVYVLYMTHVHEEKCSLIKYLAVHRSCRFLAELLTGVQQNHALLLCSAYIFQGVISHIYRDIT